MKTGIWVFAGPRNHNTNNEREQSRPLEHNTGQGNNKGTSVSTPRLLLSAVLLACRIGTSAS